MTSRATLEITELREPTATSARGNHLLVDCTIEWDREANAWRATSDDGTQVVDERKTRAAVLCLAERAGAGLLKSLAAAMRDSERRITTYYAALRSVGVSVDQLNEAYEKTAAAVAECNCEAIIRGMGEAKPEHKEAGHEPDCVSTNHFGGWAPAAVIEGTIPNDIARELLGLADLTERVRLLRATQRPGEQLSEGTTPTAAGHIASAITKLERQLDELRRR